MCVYLCVFMCVCSCVFVCVCACACMCVLLIWPTFLGVQRHLCLYVDQPIVHCVIIPCCKVKNALRISYGEAKFVRALMGYR